MALSDILRHRSNQVAFGVKRTSDCALRMAASDHIAARHTDGRMSIPTGSAFFPKRRGMQSGYSVHQHTHTVVPPQ